jgi:hypothetical protein
VSTEWWQADVVWKDSKQPVEKKEDRKVPSGEEDAPPKKVTPRIKVKQMEGLAALKMYAGRKRMFKGHKWERVQAKREKRTQILMRDMSKRIARYKEVRTLLANPVPVGRLTGRSSSGTAVASPTHSGHQGVPRLPSFRSRTYPPYNTLQQYQSSSRSAGSRRVLHRRIAGLSWRVNQHLQKCRQRNGQEMSSRSTFTFGCSLLYFSDDCLISFVLEATAHSSMRLEDHRLFNG